MHSPHDERFEFVKLEVPSTWLSLESGGKWLGGKFYRAPGKSPSSKLGVLDKGGSAPGTKPLEDGGGKYSAKEKAAIMKREEEMKAKEMGSNAKSSNDNPGTVKEWVSSLLQEAKKYPKSEAREYLDRLKDGITGKDKDNDRTFLNKPGTPIPDYLMPDDLVGWISQESLARGKRYDPDNTSTFKWDGKKIVLNE